MSEFLKPPAEVDADTFREADVLLDRPLTSPLDVLYTYGALYVSASPVSGKYPMFLTPGASAGWIRDGSTAVVAADVDLTDPDNPSVAGVTVRNEYTEDLLEKVAHSWNSGGNATDHSITHKGASSKRGGDYAAKTLKKRSLKGWAKKETVKQVAENHDDGWIISSLRDLYQDDAEMERLDEAVQEAVTDDAKFIVTVRVKLAGDDDFRWPCDVDVFQDAMLETKLENYTEKNDGKSVATGTCYLTGDEDARLVGMADDPLNLFLTKQQESFPNINNDEAWRARPVSQEAAAVLDHASEFVDACDRGLNMYGGSLFALPYYRDCTPEMAAELYETLYRLYQERDDDSSVPLKRMLEDSENEDMPDVPADLRVYLAVVEKEQDKLYNVFSDSMGADVFTPRRVIDAHYSITDSWLIGSDASTAAFTYPESDGENEIGKKTLLQQTPDPITSKVGAGMYFDRTLPYNPSEAESDDPRITAQLAVFGDGKIPADSLISRYVERVAANPVHFSESAVIQEQFVQLGALASADVLTASDPDDPITTSPTYMDSNTQTTADEQRDDTHDDGDESESASELRRKKLERFIEDSPVLRDDDERRAVFLCGVLIGRVSSYQRAARGMNRTLAQQYQIDNIRPRQLMGVVTTALTKAGQYASASRFDSDMLYRETIDEAVKYLKNRGVTGLSLQQDEVQFWYALGVKYGLSDKAGTDADSETESAETDNAVATSD